MRHASTENCDTSIADMHVTIRIRDIYVMHAVHETWSVATTHHLRVDCHD